MGEEQERDGEKGNRLRVECDQLVLKPRCARQSAVQKTRAGGETPPDHNVPTKNREQYEDVQTNEVFTHFMACL